MPAAKIILVTCSSDLREDPVKCLEKIFEEKKWRLFSFDCGCPEQGQELDSIMTEILCLLSWSSL